MNRSEFVEKLGEQVKFCNEHPTRREMPPVFKLSVLMDSGPRLRAGQNEQYCPITFLHNQLCHENEEPCQIHEFGKAAAALGLSDDDAEIIVSAADNQFMIGEEANEEARALRPELIKACGLHAAGGA